MILRKSEIHPNPYKAGHGGLCFFGKHALIPSHKCSFSPVAVLTARGRKDHPKDKEDGK